MCEQWPTKNNQTYDFPFIVRNMSTLVNCNKTECTRTPHNNYMYASCQCTAYQPLCISSKSTTASVSCIHGYNFHNNDNSDYVLYAAAWLVGLKRDTKKRGKKFKCESVIKINTNT